MYSYLVIFILEKKMKNEKENELMKFFLNVKANILKVQT